MALAWHLKGCDHFGTPVPEAKNHPGMQHGNNGGVKYFPQRETPVNSF